MCPRGQEDLSRLFLPDLAEALTLAREQQPTRQGVGPNGTVRVLDVHPHPSGSAERERRERGGVGDAEVKAGSVRRDRTREPRATIGLEADPDVIGVSAQVAAQESPQRAAGTRPGVGAPPLQGAPQQRRPAR